MKKNQLLTDHDAGKAFVHELLNTREVRRMLSIVLPEALNVYAGKSRVRKFFARMAGRHISRNLSRDGDVSGDREIERLLKDDVFIRKAAESLPDMVNALLGMTGTAIATVEGLETNSKKEMFENLFAKMAAGEGGDIITRGCRILNDIHNDDPEFFTRTMAPGFRKWIESVDFGELKEAVDNSATDTRAFVIMANNVLWEYPAKVVLLLSLLPSVVNMVTESADISLARMNRLPADLLTDVVLSLVREIEAPPVAGLVNQLAELARKVHTGSALLGEPGAPQLPKLLSGKIAEIVTNTDPVVLWKARLAMAETGAAINMAMTDAVNSQADLKQLSMIKKPEITNIRVKAFNHALSWWDGIDDDDAADSISQNLSAYDVQGIGEAINNLLRIFNRTADRQPELVPQLIAEFTSAIDDDALAEASSRIFGEADAGQSPVARAVVPQLVQWVLNTLSPADDEYEDDARQAREMLQNLLAQEEV